MIVHTTNGTVELVNGKQVEPWRERSGAEILAEWESEFREQRADEIRRRVFGPLAASKDERAAQMRQEVMWGRW